MARAHGSEPCGRRFESFHPSYGRASGMGSFRSIAQRESVPLIRGKFLVRVQVERLQRHFQTVMVKLPMMIRAQTNKISGGIDLTDQGLI